MLPTTNCKAGAGRGSSQSGLVGGLDAKRSSTAVASGRDSCEVFDVICLGILVADVIARPVDRLPRVGTLAAVDLISLRRGGCALNTSSALGRLGLHTAGAARRRDRRRRLPLSRATPRRRARPRRPRRRACGGAARRGAAPRYPHLARYGVRSAGALGARPAGWPLERAARFANAAGALATTAVGVFEGVGDLAATLELAEANT